MEALSTTWNEMNLIAQNRNFLLLMSGFSIAMGAVWALLMVESQLVEPCGYTDEFAGLCGACLLGTGVVAAFALSYVMETTKEYVTLQKVNLCLFAVAVATLYVNNRPGNKCGVACFLFGSVSSRERCALRSSLRCAAAQTETTALRPLGRTVVIASWSFLGLTLEPLMPLTLEHAAEMTFPVPADSSTALLLVRTQWGLQVL